jgi:hypothetical protein
MEILTICATRFLANVPPTGALGLVIGWLWRQLWIGMSMCFALCLLASAVFAQAASVTTQHNDNQRTGLNPLESTLLPNNTQWGTFGRVFTASWGNCDGSGNLECFPGRVQTQPLFVPGVQIQGKSTNLLLLLANTGTLYAYDVNIPSKPVLVYPGVLLDDPTKNVVLNAISTPVVDASKSLLYVIYDYVQEDAADCTSACQVSCKITAPPSWPMDKCDSGYHFALAKIDITNGKVVGHSVSDNWDVTSTRGGESIKFEPITVYSRPALLLEPTTGTVYAGFGAIAVYEGDSQYNYHGWVIGFDSATLQSRLFFCLTPHSPSTGGANLNTTKSGGGIWQSGTGLSADSRGNIYFLVGNGKYGNSTLAPGIRPSDSYEDSYVKLPPAPAWLSGEAPVEQAPLLRPLRQTISASRHSTPIWDQAVR